MKGETTVQLVLEIIVAILIIAIFAILVFPALCNAGITNLCGI
jgi:multidrug efflux pump subunit AcrB